MRVTVSIPDDVFETIEHIKGWTDQKRSQIYADALRDYVARWEIEEDRQVKAFMEAASREVGLAPVRPLARAPLPVGSPTLPARPRPLSRSRKLIEK
jgi:predicted transcriptional regulator